VGKKKKKRFTTVSVVEVGFHREQGCRLVRTGCTLLPGRGGKKKVGGKGRPGGGKPSGWWRIKRRVNYSGGRGVSRFGVVGEKIINQNFRNKRGAPRLVTRLNPARGGYRVAY